MQTERQVIAAYFNREGEAENAIRELRASGIRSDQIGCSYDEPSSAERGKVGSGVSEDRNIEGSHNRSFWQKVEGFFKGEEGYEDRNTGAEDGRLNEGMRVGPTLQIPDRYRSRLDTGGCIVTVHADNRIAEVEEILIRNGGEIDRDTSSWRESAGNTAEATRARDAKLGREANVTGDIGERRIRLISEVLRVNKERVQTGEVRLRKETHTEQQNVEVPVTREELVIERVETKAGTPATGEIGSNEEIRVPLSEERVVVDKQPVVREEVRVGKKTVQDTKHVADQVRHEELKVDEEKRLKEEETLRNKKPRKIA